MCILRFRGRAMIAATVRVRVGIRVVVTHLAIHAYSIPPPHVYPIGRDQGCGYD